MELKTYNFLKTIKMIKAIGITKKLKTGKVLLNNISFEVNKGEFVGILGASGAGKTLTLRSLIGLMDLNAGEVWIEQDKNQHKDIYKSKSKILKKSVAKLHSFFKDII